MDGPTGFPRGKLIHLIPRPIRAFRLTCGRKGAIGHYASSAPKGPREAPLSQYLTNENESGLARHGDQSQGDVRAKVTGTIWGIACGMLGICIPLVPLTQSGAMLPVVVVAGATVGTAAVWLGGSRAQRPAGPSASEKAMQARVADLEERLASLEVITNFEGRLLEKQQSQRMPEPSIEPVSPPHPEARRLPLTQ